MGTVLQHKELPEALEQANLIDGNGAAAQGADARILSGNGRDAQSTMRDLAPPTPTAQLALCSG
jgi:hypothetical protein